KHIVEDSKNSFFDFTCVTGSTDQDHFTGEVDYGKVFRTGTVSLRVRQKSGRADDGPISLYGFENFFFCRPKKQIVGEEVGPRGFANDADVQLELWICAGIAVAYIQRFTLHVSAYFL